LTVQTFSFRVPIGIKWDAITACEDAKSNHVSGEVLRDVLLSEHNQLRTCSKASRILNKKYLGSAEKVRSVRRGGQIRNKVFEDVY